MSVKKGRKQSKEDVKGWKKHSLAVIHCPEPEQPHVLATFLANGEVIVEMEDKAPETRKLHICRAWSLRDRPSIITVITRPKKNMKKFALGKI